MSDLGRISYESYWKYKVLEYINENKSNKITIENISKSTGLNFVDIAATLQKNDLLKYREDKNGPKYEVVIEDQLWSNLKKPKIIVNDDALRWTPLVFLSNQSSNNESMETDASNETGAASKSAALNQSELNELDNEQMKSGPVNNSVNNNYQVLKKKKRKWKRNKTGFDTKKPKTKKKRPISTLTNGNSKAISSNHKEEDGNLISSKSKEDELTEESTEEEEELFRNETTDDECLNATLNGDDSNSQLRSQIDSYFDCKTSQDSSDKIVI